MIYDILRRHLSDVHFRVPTALLMLCELNL